MKKWENPLQGLLLPLLMLFQLVKALNALILAIHQIPVKTQHHAFPSNQLCMEGFKRNKHFFGVCN